MVVVPSSKGRGGSCFDARSLIFSMEIRKKFTRDLRFHHSVTAIFGFFSRKPVLDEIALFQLTMEESVTITRQ